MTNRLSLNCPSFWTSEHKTLTNSIFIDDSLSFGLGGGRHWKVDARGEEPAKERNVGGGISLFVGGPDSSRIRIMEGRNAAYYSIFGQYYGIEVT